MGTFAVIKHVSIIMVGLSYTEGTLGGLAMPWNYTV